MKTIKIIFIAHNKGVFLPALLALLLCLCDLSYAVVLEDSSPAQNKAVSATPLSAVSQDSNPKTPDYAPGEVIVKLKQKVESKTLYAMSYSSRASSDTSILDNIKAKYNLKDEKPVFESLHNQLKAKNLSQAKLMSTTTSSKPTVDLLPIYVLKTDQDVIATCNKLKQDPDVEYAEPNYIRKIQMIPDDPYYHSSGSWGQPYNDLWGLKKIHCGEAWDISQGEGVVVAVIDTGVDYNHPDLAENIWTNPGEIPNNGIDDDGNGYIDDVRGWDFATYGGGGNDNDPMDGHGHGTHVSGTIAAVGNNTIGIIGVAPKVKIMAVKGLSNGGSGYDSDLANCVIYAADNGANILSNSWGGSGTSEVLIDAFHYADSKGCVAIAAAGNSNMDTSGFHPANIDTVIAVAATNQNDEKCSFSNWGLKIDVAAPGGDSPSGNGNNEWGRNILSLRSDNNNHPTDMYNDSKSIVGDKYYRSRGTSMACPHVAGVAALILSKNPNLNAKEVWSIIQISSDDIGELGKDALFGYGRVNAYNACKSGRISSFISYPKGGNFIRGNIEIVGSAYAEEDLFQRYELYYAQKNDPTNTTLLTSSSVAVDGGVLGTWNTVQCKDADYIITLKAFFYDNKELRYVVEVTVDNVNEPPIFNNLRNKGAVIGRRLEFKVEVKDPDDPTTAWGELQCILSQHNLPASTNFGFDPATQIFFWEPSIDDKGVYELTFTAKDSEYTVTKTITLSTVYLEESNPVVDNLLTLSNTHIDGDNIAWVSEKSGVWGIHVYNLSTGQEIRVTPNPAWEGQSYYSFNMSGGKIVWQDARDRDAATGRVNYDIYMYDIATGEERLIAGGPSWQDTPDIYGEKIVWNNNYDICMYDLSTGVTRRLDSLPGVQTGAAIWEDKIVWVDIPSLADPNADWNIYMHDLTKDQQVQITTRETRQHSPNIHSNKIVWVENPGKPDRTLDLYLYDLSTGREIKLASSLDYHYSYHANIYDNKVVWYDNAKSGNFDIYMFDLVREQEIQITDNERRQWIADIYENKVTWEDGRNGYKIYMAKLFFVPEIKSISHATRAPGSRLSIVGEDFGYKQDDSSVIFTNGISAPVESWSNTNIICRIPENAQSGPLKIVTKGGKSNEVNITILRENLPPEFEPINDKNSFEGSLLQFTISATDPDGDALTYSAIGLPQGAAFSGQTFTWTPTYEQAGSYNVTFTVSDGELSDSETVTITVNNINRPPELDPIGDKECKEGEWLKFEINATDPDGDKIILSAENLPSGAVLDGSTFYWAPDYNQSGDYKVTFTASDGDLKATETIKITVNNVNRPPVIVPIGNKTIDEGKLVTFTILAKDPDNDKINYSASNLPKGATLDSATGLFSWKPTYYQAGAYKLTFTVSDGSLTASDTITISVRNVNGPPQIEPIGDKTVKRWEWLRFIVRAADPDNDRISYYLADKPQGAHISIRTGEFAWRPNINQAGSFKVTVLVRDSKGNQSSETITITVPNSPPVLNPVGDKTVRPNQTLSFRLSAYDPDRMDDHRLRFYADSLPKGATLHPVSGIFHWRPNKNQKGTYQIRFGVRDPFGLNDEKMATITVK